MNEGHYGEITFPPGVQFNEATPDDFKVNCADEIRARDSCCGSLHLKHKVIRPIYQYSDFLHGSETFRTNFYILVEWCFPYLQVSFAN